MRSVAEVKDIIRAYRAYFGISKFELHLRSGVSVDAITRLETGTGRVYLDTFERLLDSIGCELKVVAKENGHD